MPGFEFGMLIGILMVAIISSGISLIAWVARHGRNGIAPGIAWGAACFIGAVLLGFLLAGPVCIAAVVAALLKPVASGERVVVLREKDSRSEVEEYRRSA